MSIQSPAIQNPTTQSSTINTSPSSKTLISHKHIELEARFIEIDVAAIKKRLLQLGAIDLGEDFLKEVIFYDKDLTWKKTPDRKLLRIRSSKNNVLVSFKHFPHNPENKFLGIKQIEVVLDNMDNAKALFEEIGLAAFREQEKKRHSFKIESKTGTVLVDIDTWPSIPSYLEIEGNSENEIKEVAEKLGLDWEKAVFLGAGYIIEHFYGINVKDLNYFTFKKIA